MSREKGFGAEDKAAEWLAKRGFEIIGRNFALRSGEIDIIARKNGVLRFVEVKSGESFDPIYAITPLKLSRVIKTAEGYMAKHNLSAPFSIDALIVRGEICEMIENITM